jgi:MFS family permease
VRAMNARTSHPDLLLATLLSGVFMGTLDTAIVNVAAPSIAQTLRPSGAELELVVAGYVAAYAALLILAARLGAMYGFARLFVLGLFVFTAASLGCGFAGTALVLIAARVVQGCGAALMVAQVLTGIGSCFSGAARTRALGFYALALSMGAVSGQILGGVLIWANLGGSTWRPVFLINVPVGIVLITAALRYLPFGTGGASRGLDLRGVATLFTSNPAVRWGLTSYGLAVGTYYALLFTIALYLQHGIGESALSSGLTLLGWVGAFGIAGVLLPRLLAGSVRRAAPIGPLIIAAAFGTISACLREHRLPETLLIALLACGGFGLGSGWIGLVSHMTSTIPVDRAPDLSGLTNTTTPVAGAIGVAIFGSAYLALARHAGVDDAYATITAGFAFTTLLAALAAHRSIRSVRPPEELTAAA